VTVKRRWPVGERSPWAGEDDPPRIFEMARMYPERALMHAFGAAFLGLLAAAFLAWGSLKLLHAFLSVAYPTSPTVLLSVVIPFWVVAFVGLWCEGMYQDVRGWSVSEW
jgi:hypothetical protein